MISTRSFILNKIPSRLLKKHLLNLLDSIMNWKQLLLGFPFLHRAFQSYLGYPLNLRSPQTFNEQIQVKKLTNRDRLLVQTSDKLLARQYVKQVLGEEEGEKILIPLYFVTDDERKIPFENLPEEYFLKANHFSGGNLLVQKDTDRQFILQKAERWLLNSYGQYFHEWAYRDIPRKLLGEKVLRDQDGKIPMDIKFYCFHGKAKMVVFILDRFGEKKRITTDIDLNPIVGGKTRADIVLSSAPEIKVFPKLVEVAEELSKEFEHVRMDFYCIDEQIYFGEFTHYCASGLTPFDDYRVDWALGQFWKEENKDKSLLEMLEEFDSGNHQNPVRKPIKLEIAV